MAFATKLEKQDLEKLVCPKLKLFLSVDVVGSTAFKQAQPHTHWRTHNSSGGPSNWLMFLSSFYRDFGTRIRFHLGRRLKDAGISDSGDPDEKVGTPHLWKALGDELVFVIELKHDSHLPIILDAFRHAINEEIDYAKSGDYPLPISLKGAAWVAGFPVCNAEIPMLADHQDVKHTKDTVKDGRVIGYDYAGPSLDIGFRISKLASPQRLIISAEIAYLLTNANGTGQLLHLLHFDGPAEFKGVLGGDEYPVFWIDCFKNVDRESWINAVGEKSHTKEQEDYYTDMEGIDVAALPSSCGPIRLHKFLESWFERHLKVLVKPFIPKTLEPLALPAKYRQQLDLVQAELRELYRSDGDRGDENPAGDRLVAEGMEAIGKGI